MQIGVLTTSFPRFEGDYAGSFISALLQSLNKDKFHISVLAPSDFILQEQNVHQEIEIKRFNYFFPRRLQRLAYNFGMSDNIRKSFLAVLQVPAFMVIYCWRSFILSVRSDILWTHWLIPSGILGATIRRITSKKHILTMHSSGGLYLLKNLPFNKQIISFIIENSDAIVLVSQDLRDRLLELLPVTLQEKTSPKLHVLSMGVDLNQHVAGNKWTLRNEYGIDTERVILFIGRLEKIKGVSYLIRAMQLIEDTTLIVAGEGGLKKELKQLAADTGQRIKFVGLAKGKVKSDYFSMCDLVVVPSITLKSGRAEGAPVVILEAFAAARPVLASNTGGIPEIIEGGYNGFLFEEKNHVAIAKLVNYLFSNKENLEQMSFNALNSAEKFDINKICREYEEIISRL